MTTYIGLVGLPGAGKSTVSTMIENQLGAVESFTIGDIVRDLAEDEGHTESAEIRQFATDMREQHGKGIFAQKLINRYTFSEDIVVIDGIRSPQEITLLQEHTTGRCIIVYVKCSYENRYEHIVNRDRDGEGEMTEEKFSERDKGELDWGMREILDTEQYEYTIVNDGTPSDLESEVTEMLETVHPTVAQKVDTE